MRVMQLCGDCGCIGHSEKFVFDQCTYYGIAKTLNLHILEVLQECRCFLWNSLIINCLTAWANLFDITSSNWSVQNTFLLIRMKNLSIEGNVGAKFFAQTALKLFQRIFLRKKNGTSASNQFAYAVNMCVGFLRTLWINIVKIDWILDGYRKWKFPSTNANHLNVCDDIFFPGFL